MKLIFYCFLTALMCCSIVNSEAQLQDGDFFLTLKGGHLNMSGFEPRYFGGLEIDRMVSENVGLHWNLNFGKGYFHMPAGPIGGLFGGFWVGSRVANSDSSESGDGLIIGVIAFAVGAIIPEGMSYHVRLSDKFYMAPYISPLQVDYMRSDRGQDTFFGGSLGLKTNILIGKEGAKLTPFIEYKTFYSRIAEPGFSAGLSWSILKRNNQ